MEIPAHVHWDRECRSRIRRRAGRIPPGTGLDEGAVGKDLGHTHAPELRGHDLKIVDEELPPRSIPCLRFAAGACDQERFAPLYVARAVAHGETRVSQAFGQCHARHLHRRSGRGSCPRSRARLGQGHRRSRNSGHDRARARVALELQECRPVCPRPLRGWQWRMGCQRRRARLFT